MNACLFVALLLLADDAKVPTELQGAWKLVSIETEAGPVNLPDPRPGFLVKGDRLNYGGKESARLVADAATNPKLFDLQFRDP